MILGALLPGIGEIIIRSAYRAPKSSISDFASSLETVLDKFDNKKKVVLIGDFNIKTCKKF